MTPRQIQRLRHELGETTAEFGGRFLRGGRAVEDWEQGRRRPDPLAAAEMERIAERLARKKSRKQSA
jgi:DNA-binding transcriptional regulator YiaG